MVSNLENLCKLKKVSGKYGRMEYTIGDNIRAFFIALPDAAVGLGRKWYNTAVERQDQVENRGINMNMGAEYEKKEFQYCGSEELFCSE